MWARQIVMSLILLFPLSLWGQINVRLFSDRRTLSAVLSVSSGSYEMFTSDGCRLKMEAGNMAAVTYLSGRLGVKCGDMPLMQCDSVWFRQVGDGGFNLRVTGRNSEMRSYSGDLMCRPDMGVIVFVNTINAEDYIAGVVQSESGTGHHREYIKTQAIIARTYMYKYKDKHIMDGFNLCDGVHCQAYHGISDNRSIKAAVDATKGLVILSSDSSLIISAFHANCGGETVPSESVWLSVEPYLRKVSDPYCTMSASSKWKKIIPLDTWTGYLKSRGCRVGNTALLNFVQTSRKRDYVVGSFSISLQQLRADFNLRSTFFNVKADGRNVILTGRGYGHGVGLCQEGAMNMAMKGMTYRQIIDFYYRGVFIADISKAKKPVDDTLSILSERQ